MSIFQRAVFVGLIFASGAAFAGECEGEYKDGYGRGFLGMESREIGECQKSFDEGYRVGKTDMDAALATDVVAARAEK